MKDDDDDDDGGGGCGGDDNGGGGGGGGDDDDDDNNNNNGSHASMIVSIFASYSQLLCLNLSWGLAVQFVISVCVWVCIIFNSSMQNLN